MQSVIVLVHFDYTSAKDKLTTSMTNKLFGIETIENSFLRKQITKAFIIVA